jgi:hypothetical protein
MTGQDYLGILLIAALFWWRLDRIGKQLEAVRDHLLLELGNEETKSEVLQDREWEKKERKRDARQFWIFWTIFGVAALIWYGVIHR